MFATAMQEPSDAQLRRILTQCRAIAVVGFSKNPDKDAHTVPRYLMEHGYRVVPVNPTADEILGLRCYQSLLDVPGPVDMVNVFRPSEDVPPVAEQAVARRAKVLWTQLGIRHDEAAARARSAGLEVVQDRCIRVEHARLMARR
jgi:hypothetical protein